MFSLSRCKLCSFVLPFEFQNINLHVKTEHNLSLSDYKGQYMGWDSRMTCDEMVNTKPTWSYQEAKVNQVNKLAEESALDHMRQEEVKTKVISKNKKSLDKIGNRKKKNLKARKQNNEEVQSSIKNKNTDDCMDDEGGEESLPHAFSNKEKGSRVEDMYEPTSASEEKPGPHGIKRMHKVTNSAQGKVFSDDIDDMCLTNCYICQMTLSADSIKRHIYRLHPGAPVKRSYTYIRKTYYR